MLHQIGLSLAFTGKSVWMSRNAEDNKFKGQAVWAVRSCPHTTLSKCRNSGPLDAKKRIAAISSGLILQEPIFSCLL